MAETSSAPAPETPAQPSPAPQAAAPAPTGVSSSTAPGLNGPLPAELGGWNWGAFLLSWIWAIGNQVWLGLLALVPLGPLPLIIAIFLGIKGNELAWNARKFESVEQFKAVQSAWAKWGVILFILSILIGVGLIVLLGVFAASTVSNSVTAPTY